ncbi:MAG: N-acetyltransferase [Endomicrobiales bacterium]|nr:N-acetyltransferase [Endomicrobiales bacterium]
MKIRQAKVSDAKTIHALINFYAEKKEMLPRSINDIYENVQEYVVAEEKGRIIGCCALHVSWEDLAEIKALAISKDHHGKGIGRKLVLTLHKKAEELGVQKVFALTFKPGFFLKMRYTQISREKLPHKIWGECVRCPLFPDCGEVPLIKSLSKKNTRAKK